MFHNHYLCLTGGEFLNQLSGEEKTFLIEVFLILRRVGRNRFMLAAEVVDSAITNQGEAPRVGVLDILERGTVVPDGDETILNNVGSEVLVVEDSHSQPLHARLKSEVAIEELGGGKFHIL